MVLSRLTNANISGGIASGTVGFVLLVLATQPIPQITSASQQRAILTQSCVGESKPVPFAWLLALSGVVNLVLAIALLLPEIPHTLILYTLLLLGKEPRRTAATVSNSVDFQPESNQTVSPEQIKEWAKEYGFPHVPESATPSELTSEPQNIESVDSADDLRSLAELETMFPSLPPHLQAILSLGFKHKDLTATIVAQSNHKHLRNPRPTAEQTRQYFLQLEKQGFGKCEGTDRSMKFRVHN